jgi:transposase
MQLTEEITEIAQPPCWKKDSCQLLQSALRENEQLRRIFRTATLEFEKKNQRIAFLEEELNQAKLKIKELENQVREIEQEKEVSKKEVDSLKKKLEEVEAKNNLLNQLAFGKKSEKKEEASPLAGKKRGARLGHPGFGRKIPQNLPIEEETIDLSDQEKFCEICGKPFHLEEIGQEPSYQVAVKKTYYLKKKNRKIYKATCACGSRIISAKRPAKLIPKGKFDTSFWVELLVNKYRNHLPIERQLVELKDFGLNISAGTIFGGLKKIHSLYLEPLDQAMKEELRKADHYFADETGWHLLAKIDDKKNYNWFGWVFISQEIVFFTFQPTRSAKVVSRTLFDLEPKELKLIGELSDEAKKKLSVDKFLAYQLLKRLGWVELFFCWAHQRREFLDLKTKYPQLSSWVEEWLKRIGTVYQINDERIKYHPEDSSFKELDQKLREKIAEIYSLINQEYNHSGQNALFKSMKKHWEGLTLFVDCPEIPMDNNSAERMLRAVVLGRNNYWGNHSFWGGKLTGAMFSIIQTCLLHQISPRDYLNYYLSECAKRGSAPTKEEIESFLPHQLPESIKEKLKIPGS